MANVIIATKNQGKSQEFSQMFKPLGYRVLTLNDFPEMPAVEEDGTSFYENAFIKASKIAKMLQQVVIADDSGLEVDALNGAPGIYSARYSGANATDASNREKLLEVLKEVPDKQRQAHFICALVIVDPLGKVIKSYEGRVDGFITHEPRGANGFGYDSLFYLPEFEQTTAEMSPEAKDKISHRGQCMQQLAQDIKTGELKLW